MIDFIENTYSKPPLIPKLLPITLEEMNGAALHPPAIVRDYLYADVRMRIAAGGTGKTTLALFEAVKLARGEELWGRRLSRPFNTAIVTREDSREILVARLREIIDAELGCSAFDDDRDSKVQAILNRVNIYDLTGCKFRVSKVENDVVNPDGEAISELIDSLREFKPDWVIFDPLVSFGVGESRVNDAEQGLIEAFRIIRNDLKCCVEGIHHTGKGNAREKTADQYSGRGGSALADGARMVAVLNPLDAQEWAKETGDYLDTDETGLVMALPKLSYSKPQDAIYIKRYGYKFEMVKVSKQTPEQENAAIVEQMYQFIYDQFTRGRKYSKSDLDAQTETLSLSRKQIRYATTELLVSGRVLYHEIKGKSGSHYEPTTLAGVGDTPRTVDVI